MELVSISTDEDGYDKRSTCDTKFDRHRNAMNGKRQTSENDTKDNSYEYSRDVRSLKTLDRVTHHRCHPVDCVLWSDCHDSVAHLKSKAWTCEDIHSLTCHSSHVYAVDTWEMHLSQSLSVDRRTGNEYSLAYHRFILFIPVNFNLRSDESVDRLGIILCTNDEEQVSHMESAFACRNRHVAFMKYACTYKIPVEEFMNLFYRAVFKIRVGDLEVHHVRFHRCILNFLLFQLLFFTFKLHPADISDGDSSANNTEHAKRVCAGISVCNLRYLSGREDCRQSLIGGTKARSVGHGSIERSNHHWQVVVVACVEENEIACEHNCDIKQDHACRQGVKRNATFSETF